MPNIQMQVDELISQMTPAEKAGQLHADLYFRLPLEAEPVLEFTADEQPKAVETALKQGGAGSLLFVTDPAGEPPATAGHRRPSADIPVLFGYDVIHGLRTILPVPIGMAATWDPQTIERGQSVAAREARAVGIHWTFAPMVDIARDPRWGRIVEGAGEDPYLGAAVAVAQVTGFQGGDVGDLSTSSPVRSTWPATEPRWADATTTRSTCRTPNSGTCTSRRSRRPSTLVPAT